MKKNQVTNINSNIDKSAIYDDLSVMGNTYKALKDIGCTPLVSISMSILQKANGIIKNIDNALNALSQEVNQLYNQDLTEEELNEKLELIKAKQDAIIQEGETKTSALAQIADLLMDLAPPIMELKSMGGSSEIIYSVINDLVGSISTSPSEIKDVKNKQDVQEQLKKNKKNIFGNDTEMKLKSQIQNLEAEIETREKSIKEDKDIDSKKKDLYKLENKIFIGQKKCLENFLKKVESIKL